MDRWDLKIPQFKYLSLGVQRSNQIHDLCATYIGGRLTEREIGRFRELEQDPDNDENN